MNKKTYKIKKGSKVLTKKRGMVKDYVTSDDLDAGLLKSLLNDGILLDSNPEKSSKKVKDEFKTTGGG